MDKLKEKLKDVPKSPGVYQFLDKDGGVLYVGKAKNLKNRIGQYLNGHDTREQIPFLLSEAVDFDYTVVNTELESAFLENTVIKQYLPRYNIMLRDDKNYAFIKIDYTCEIPQIGYARRVEGSGDRVQSLHPTRSPLRPKFFGPYSAAYKIRNTLNLLRRIFPYCAAEKVSTRPCFYYYLHRCPGVCIGKISLEEYRKYVDEKICSFLAGDTTKIKKQLEVEMKLASSEQLFEKAARLRDQCNALQLLEEKQVVILPKAVSWDIVSLATDAGYACVNLFKVRDGKLKDKESFVFEVPNSDAELRKENGTTEGYGNNGTKIVQTFLEQYYLETSDAPSCVYTQLPADDTELIEHIIRSRFDKKLQVINPQKGKPRELIELGITNAQEYLKNWLASQAGHLDKINKALEQLKEVLHLEKVPQRIECYDISNIQGTNAVGSMVVFEQGLPKKSEYRKFKIKSKSTPDDFAMMREMLSRRLSRMQYSPPGTGGVSRHSWDGVVDKKKLPPPPASQGTPPFQEESTAAAWPTPDLIVIDGGKGQLGVAVETIQQSNNPTIPVIGLAKRIEEIFLPENPVPIILGHDQPALQMLQRLRDEAHRFGITFHRLLRSKQAVRSALDDIPGIGPKTKKLLKQKFGTVANIKKASTEELIAVVGEKLAKVIRENI